MNSSPSSVRRLLKARREEVAAVSITAKPRAVFDSQDLTSPYTQYVIKLRSSNSSTKEEWKLRKRYSDFYSLHQTLRRSRSQWETTCLKQGEAFATVVAILQRAAGSEFPRKHIRCDTSAIVKERRRGLMDYVRTLLAAYTDLEVLLGAPGNLRGNFVDEIVCVNAVFVEIERFLEIPPIRKQIEARLTRAVAALEAVKGGEEKTTLQCCICLSESQPTGGDLEMAQLPCAHVFHEDCIIHWFQCSSTCPMCRHAVGKASRRVAVG